ncbi:hypothetical protein PENTCL1PPCAC_4454, partial [Pristionchus entomophagus]
LPSLPSARPLPSSLSSGRFTLAVVSRSKMSSSSSSSTSRSLLLLLLLSSLVSTVNGQRLCGRRLTEALSVVCDHKYHRPTREQLNTVRTHSSGIATKCCRNRCPYEELSKYCTYRMPCCTPLPGPTAHWTDQYSRPS